MESLGPAGGTCAPHLSSSKFGSLTMMSKPQTISEDCMKTRRLARYLWTGANPQFRALLVLILCAGLNAYAQQITGTIAGTVKDPQGAVVISAAVKRFVQQNLVLTVDQTQALNVVLAVGVESQTVTVTGTPPLVETNSAELGRTVEPSEIIGLPLVNRNAYAELSLTPGVQANSASPSSNPSGTPNS